jgi:trigger factor
MQTSVETTGNLERRVTFQLPAQQVEGEVGGRLREIARTARIKGFRPGKVPAKVIEQRYGEQVRAEVLDGLLREGFDQAVRGNDLRIAGSPTIEPTDAKDGELAYVATFEVVPDFGDIDVTTLDVVRYTADVSEDDIDRMIENLRLQRRSWGAVEREAREGDAVEAQTWSMLDGQRVPAEGSERLLTVIGTNSVLPRLEQALVGMRAGEEKAVDIEFPADWRVAELAGKNAQANLRLERVSESVVPEADAAFIRSFGVKSGDLAQFRADIRSNLERELKGALMARLRREVSEKLAAAYAHVELPPRLVENEARMLARQAAERIRRQGGNPQMPEDAHVDFLDGARKRVLVGLLVGEVARRNELRLEMSRVNETLRLIASTYEEPQQVIEMYRDDPQLMAGLQSQVMEEQVIDWIAERARHRDEPLSFQEAISPSA